MTLVEEQRKKVKEVEKTLREFEMSVSTDKKGLEEDLGKLQGYREELLQKRNFAKKGLRPEFATIYDRVATRNREQVIALAKNGMCVGCNVKIQPQLFNEILGFKTLHRCGNCGRILIAQLPETDDDSST